MPTRYLTDAELHALEAWPQQVQRSDLAAFFTPSIDDVRWVRSHRGSANRLGLALQLCCLPYLGFIPKELDAAPAEVVSRLAGQLGVAASAVSRYVAEAEPRTRRDHTGWVIARAGWRQCGRGEFKRLSDWLVARALEHDVPSVLFRQALHYLKAERIVRPGPDRLMRAVAAARAAANEQIHWRLRPLLTPHRRAQLDDLVTTDPDLGTSPLVWLEEGAVSASPDSIKAEITKLNYLRSATADRLDVAAVPPERIRQLAALARRSTPKALARMAPERRYPILLAALTVTYSDVLDEVVQLFDQALSATDQRARKNVVEHQLAAAESNFERLELLDDILEIALDESLSEAAVGSKVRGLGIERLQSAVRRDHERGARDGGHLQLMEARFNYVRSFAPAVLGAIEFSASVSPSEVLDAVRLLHEMNAQGRRHVPNRAPDGFVPSRWRPYLEAAEATGNRTAYKHYWELCVLFALRAGLRSGEIWVRGSRRYANPASYLIPAHAWPSLRAEVLEMAGRPADFRQRLQGIDSDLERLLGELEDLLRDPDEPVRLDASGDLHLRPLTAERVNPSVLQERSRVVARLPSIPLAELLIEVDQATGFSARLVDAAGASPRLSELEHRRNLYAAIVAQACNFGIARMSELTGIGADALEWTTRWYLRDETLRAANTAIVNAHHRHPLSKAWGGGTLSSSDGLRFPMRGKSLSARALSRYFVDEGVTTYTHISDQHTTYGTQVIVPTERDATYTLDEILGNTTELPVTEHATDTHGQTLLTFALFDLVGLQLSPRIANLVGQRLWRPHSADHYAAWPLSGPLLAHHAQVDLVGEHWDELLRIAGSLKLGYVSAALLVSKLQSGSRRHPLAKALIEYGKLLRTVHALKWFTDEAFRRRIGRQLNKGESLHDLRRFIRFAHQGEVRHHHHDDQTMQAHCHTLVVNACILSTTGYLQDAIDAHRAAGYEVTDEVIGHTSPAHFEQINPYGVYVFDVARLLKRTGRRPLRNL